MKKLNVLTRMLLLVALLVGSTSSVWADDTYTKVTSTSDLEVDAEYILLETSTNTTYLANTTFSSSKYGSVTSGFTISGNNVTVTTGTNALVLKLGGSSGAWTLYDKNYKGWLGKGDSNTNLARSQNSSVPTSNNAYYWTIKQKGSEYAVYSNYKSSSKDHTGRYLGRNNTSISSYDGDNYPACVLYKKVVSKTDPTITFNDGSVRVGKTLDVSTLFTSNSTGAVTYSITEGGSYATLSGSTITGVAEGSVTVQASQAATATHNAKTVTATITVNPVSALKSIAITTAPTKTTYDEGDVFDPTGMVVTATYVDESTENVTASCTYSPNGALSTSDTEITVSYSENDVTKTAKQTITVNAYVQSTDVTVTFNNEFLGVNEGTRISAKTTKTQDKVSFVFDKPSGSNWPQGDAGVIRMYDGTTLQITAPAGYAITNITFTANGDWKSGMTASAGSYDDALDANNKTYWTGSASSVTFAPGGSHRIATVNVKLSNTVKVTLATACTDGTNYYGTYSFGTAFVVPEGVTVSAITVADDKLTVTDYSTGDIVKANTGVMVSSSTAGDKVLTLSASAGAEVDGNMLKSSGEAGITADAMEAANENCVFYRLTMHNETDLGFYWGAASGAAFALAANKAYLAVPTALAKEGFSFSGSEEETDGINAVVNNTENGVRYNLAGQKVGADYKGIVIVNGKKVIIK